ncbi:putative peptidoglycan lipid II flippase [Streptomyces canus]
MTVTPPRPSGSTGSGFGLGHGYGSGTDAESGYGVGSGSGSGMGPESAYGVTSGEESGTGHGPGTGTPPKTGPGTPLDTPSGTPPGPGGPLVVPAARGVADAVRPAPELPPVSRRFLAKATAVTAALSVAGALLGLVRDQSLARLFGAGSGTDAFLVAWTVPEFASTLLIEDGLAFVLIPAFSLALARRARGAPGDPVRSLVAATLPRLTLVFVAASALIVAAAPYLVRALAPGLPDPALAVDCTRLTATCVLSFGLAGYCSAVLRAHRRFLMPGAIYVAYNAGIITAMFVLGGDWGVRSAAAGVAAGGALMVAVQLPAVWRQLRHSPVRREEPAETPDRAVTLALVAPVLLFALCRQSQVLVERFLASPLPAGAISHLNYAQKVAQIPMTLSLMLCTVTFPVVARALADGDTERARTRVERDLVLAACTVLLGAATVIACAPQIVEVLFQRGAFTARDTAATAGVMRVYALGLLGQTLVGVLIRSYFSAGRPTWYPVCAMAAGIVLTSWSGAWAVGPWGVSGIAAANAAGITVTASLLLAGMGTTYRGVPRGVLVRTRQVLARLGRPVCAAAVATPAGGLVASRAGAPLPGLLTGSATVAAVFVLLGLALGVQGFAPALRSVRAAVRTFTRRLPHGR